VIEVVKGILNRVCNSWLSVTTPGDKSPGWKLKPAEAGYLDNASACFSFQPWNLFRGDRQSWITPD